MAAAHLVTEGIDLYNQHIVVRHYDDVLAEEYAEYLDYRQYDRTLLSRSLVSNPLPHHATPSSNFRADCRCAVGMGIPMGIPWVWIWGGYGDRNSVPTAALADCQRH